MKGVDQPPAEPLFADRDRDTWLLSLRLRTDRLVRLIELADASPPAPRFLVSAEIDLVRGALDALDTLCGDRATRDAIRASLAAGEPAA